MALGALLGIQITLFLAKKEGYDSPQIKESLYQLLIYLLAGGLLGARFIYVVLNWNNFSSQPLSILKIWEGGLVYYGGFMGALISTVLWKRKNNLPWKKVADWVAPGLTFGHALGRLGCLSAGCCYGLPTSMPWGITFTDPNSLAPLYKSLHPTQIYEFLYLLSLGLFLLCRSSQKRSEKLVKDGTIFIEYILLYSLGRFIIEFYRADAPLTWNLTPGQISSLFFFIPAILWRIRSA